MLPQCDIKSSECQSLKFWNFPKKYMNNSGKRIIKAVFVFN